MSRKRRSSPSDPPEILFGEENDKPVSSVSRDLPCSSTYAPIFGALRKFVKPVCQPNQRRTVANVSAPEIRPFSSLDEFRTGNSKKSLSPLLKLPRLSSSAIFNLLQSSDDSNKNATKRPPVPKLLADRFVVNTLPKNCTKDLIESAHPVKSGIGTIDGDSQNPETQSLPLANLKYILQILNPNLETMNGELLKDIEIPAKTSNILIGRCSHAPPSIEIPQGSVSKVHARLIYQNSKWHIQSITERSRTCINGAPFQESGISLPIEANDTIEFGNVSYKFLEINKPIDDQLTDPLKKTVVERFEYATSTGFQVESNPNVQKTDRRQRNHAYEAYLNTFKLENCPEAIKLLEELKDKMCVVYELGYETQMGEFTVYYGITCRPDIRFVEHPNETKNAKKYAIFKKERVFMRILYVGTIEKCMILEALLIQNCSKDDSVHLTNKYLKQSEIKLKSKIEVALKQLLRNSKKVNLQRYHNTEAFGDSWKNFEVSKVDCEEFRELLEEIESPNHFVYSLQYIDDNGALFLFYIGVTGNPVQRMVKHPYCKGNKQKYEIFQNYRGQIFQKILFKGTRAQCELVEQLVIQNDENGNLVNVSKVDAEVIETDCNVKNAVKEMLTRTEADKSMLYATDAENSEDVKGYERLSKWHLKKSIENADEKFQKIRNNDVKLVIPKQITPLLAEQNLKNLRKPETIAIGSGKTSIISVKDIIKPANIPGTFKNLTYDQFREWMFDSNSATLFCARMGLLANSRKCVKSGCSEMMSLHKTYKDNVKTAYRWRCGNRSCCSSGPLLADSFIGVTNGTIENVLKAIFLYSTNHTRAQIVNFLVPKKAEGAKLAPSQTFIDKVIKFINDLLAEAIVGSYEFKNDFLKDENIDRVGIVLHLICLKYVVNK